MADEATACAARRPCPRSATSAPACVDRFTLSSSGSIKPIQDEARLVEMESQNEARLANVPPRLPTSG
jgi:hypothetical protein